MIPSYLTHYHFPDRKLFLNLSAVNEPELADVLNELRAKCERKELESFLANWYIGYPNYIEAQLWNDVPMLKYLS